MTVDPNRVSEGAFGAVAVFLAGGVVYLSPGIIANPIASRLLAGIFLILFVAFFGVLGLGLIFAPDEVVRHHPSEPTDVPRRRPPPPPDDGKSPSARWSP